MNFSYRTKLALVSFVPILIFAVVSIIIGFVQFQSNLYEEKQGHLKSTALAALALYSSHGYGDYGRKADGNVWRGMNFNVSAETSVVDDLKEQTGVDITFFFGDTPEMSSIFDKNGTRFVETDALDDIYNYTLKQGTQLWCREIQINGKACQAYIIPIRQSSNNSVAGALMASQSTEGFNNIIRKFILTTLLAALITLIIALLFIRWSVNRLSQEYDTVSNKSKHDLLTGLYNKRSFEEEVQKTIDAQNPEDVSVLLIFDFDNFKTINDTYGHATGDEVLKSFAAVLVRAFRTHDLIGRIGGDEFMVFMPGMLAEHLKRPDEISREILNELAAMKVGAAEHFSCSIGIGTDSKGYNFKTHYKLADKALYQSKENGKACYTRYSSDEIIFD